MSQRCKGGLMLRLGMGLGGWVGIIYSNQLRISFRNERRVMTPHDNVNHADFVNMTKSFKITLYDPKNHILSFLKKKTQIDSSPTEL